MSAVLLAKDKIEDSDATHALIFGEKDWIKAILDGTKDWELRTQRLIKIADGGPPVGFQKQLLHRCVHIDLKYGNLGIR